MKYLVIKSYLKHWNRFPLVLMGKQYLKSHWDEKSSSQQRRKAFKRIQEFAKGWGSQLQRPQNLWSGGGEGGSGSEPAALEEI